MKNLNRETILKQCVNRVLSKKSQLKPFNINISRIAFGIPVGSDLEFADEITLARAIEGRRLID